MVAAGAVEGFSVDKVSDDSDELDVLVDPEDERDSEEDDEYGGA